MSSGGSAPSQQTVNQVTIPPELMPYAQRTLGTAENLVYNKPYETYSGQRFAGLNPLMMQGFEATGQQGVAPQMGEASGLASLAGRQAGQMGAYAPSQYRGMGVNYLGTQAPQLQQFQMGPAERVGAERFGGAQAAEYMSPYMSSVVDQQKAAAIRDYSRQIPGLQAAGIRAGARGGSREAILQAEAQRNLQDQLGGIEATGRQTAFQNAQQQFGADRAAAMQAAMANQAAGLTTGQQNLGALLGIQQLGAGQNLQAQLANQQAQLQAQQQALGQEQFGAEFGERSRQFGANLGLQGLQQQLAAAGTLGQLGQSQFNQQQQAAQNQLQAGSQLQMQEQQRLQAAYEDFLARQRYPYSQLGFMSDLIRGTPTAGGIQTMYQSPPSLLGQAAGAGLGIAGLSQAFKGG